jgi:hypothetical protein
MWGKLAQRIGVAILLLRLSSFAYKQWDARVAERQAAEEAATMRRRAAEEAIAKHVALRREMGALDVRSRELLRTIEDARDESRALALER